MARRHKQPFRPYRLTDRRPKTEFVRETPMPAEPPIYPTGHVIYAVDKTNRLIEKVQSRERVWVYHWRALNTDATGVTVESHLRDIDSFYRKD